DRLAVGRKSWRFLPVLRFSHVQLAGLRRCQVIDPQIAAEQARECDFLPVRGHRKMERSDASEFDLGIEMQRGVSLCRDIQEMQTPAAIGELHIWRSSLGEV